MSAAVDIRSEDFLDRPVECLAALRASAPACPCTRSYIIRGPLEMRATVHRRAGR